MKKMLKLSILVVAMFGGVVMIWSKTVKAESSPRETVAEATAKLYNSNCARCHGADGKGNTKLGEEMGIPDLATSRMTSAKIKRVIIHGDGDMPAFKKFTPAQLNSLVSYVRALRR